MDEDYRVKPQEALERRPRPETIEQRLRRIETRICKIMIHLGVDPHETQHDQQRAEHPQSNRTVGEDATGRGERIAAPDGRRSFFHSLFPSSK